jgi:hypothetical protein
VDRDALTGLRTGRPLTRIRGPVAAIWIDIDRGADVDEAWHRAESAIAANARRNTVAVAR